MLGAAVATQLTGWPNGWALSSNEGEARAALQRDNSAWACAPRPSGLIKCVRTHQATRRRKWRPEVDIEASSRTGWCGRLVRGYRNEAHATSSLPRRDMFWAYPSTRCRPLRRPAARLSQHTGRGAILRLRPIQQPFSRVRSALQEDRLQRHGLCKTRRDTPSEEARPIMRFECPECHEAQVDYVGMTEDAKTELRCRLCQYEWRHSRPATSASPRTRPLSLAQAKARFPAASDVTHEDQLRVRHLKKKFLRGQPRPDPEVAPYWARYQQIFSADGLPQANPHDLKAFANSRIGANPGNMSVFNKAWNDEGNEAAADRLRGVIEHLLRGTDGLGIEDRMQRLIDPQEVVGMTGFRESLLTKVLCVMQSDRFLPILIYTSPAGGKRQIASAVFGLDLPAPETTSMTKGRLAFWSNDLLREATGDGLADMPHAAEFLWWAKDRR